MPPAVVWYSYQPTTIYFRSSTVAFIADYPDEKNKKPRRPGSTMSYLFRPRSWLGCVASGHLWPWSALFCTVQKSTPTVQSPAQRHRGL